MSEVTRDDREAAVVALRETGPVVMKWIAKGTVKEGALFNTDLERVAEAISIARRSKDEDIEWLKEKVSDLDRQLAIARTGVTL